jgi:hypothetical protein
VWVTVFEEEGFEGGGVGREFEEDGGGWGEDDCGGVAGAESDFLVFFVESPKGMFEFNVVVWGTWAKLVSGKA